MRATITKTEIESEIAARFGDAFRLHEKRPREVLSSGVAEIDSFVGGLPRGALTEIFGPASSGRTSFMLSAMAHATSNDEVCALVDTSNVFDPRSAAAAGMKFDRLLWIRCANHLEHAFKATDMLLQAGGFGLVMLDLGDVPAKSAKRIISSWWYRFRRTLESTPTALVVIVEESAVKSCAALALELKGENTLWADQFEIIRSHPVVASISQPSMKLQPSRQNHFAYPHANLLRGRSFQVECRRPLYLERSTNSRGSSINAESVR
jgi:recA bacterial DNA recombination protein